jgi:hypothetical protein
MRGGNLGAAALALAQNGSGLPETGDLRASRALADELASTGRGILERDGHVAAQAWTGHWLFPRRITVTRRTRRQEVEHVYYRRTGQAALLLEMTRVRDRASGDWREFHHAGRGLREHIIHLHAVPLLPPTRRRPGRIQLVVDVERRY